MSADAEAPVARTPIDVVEPPTAVHRPRSLPPPPPFLEPSKRGDARRRATTTGPPSLRHRDAAGSAGAITPTPARRCPIYMLQGRHEASLELDVDWTLSEDLAEEQQLREARSKLIKTQLLEGAAVCYRSSGWSLCPRVRSNDQTTDEPVTSADIVQVGDIVSCEVQPANSFYAHMLKRKEWCSGNWLFTISNMRG